MSATEGDVLGGQFHISGSHAAGTPHYFTGGTTSADKVGFKFGEPSLGSEFATDSAPEPSRRVNMEGILESDEDGDGYGDYSQDLCLGSPIAITACSGALFGSDLQGARTTMGQCGFSCVRVQTLTRHLTIRRSG